MSELSGLSALIIEPHAATRGSLANLLQTCGLVRIESAASAGAAIRRLCVQSFDMILCENNLEGGQDGQQMLEDLRYHKLMHASTLFFMVTGERHTSKVTSAAELAPADYILKPFTIESVLERLGRALDKRDVFLPIQQLVEIGAERAALDACVEGAAAQPRYAVDFLRLRAELHLLLGEPDQAEPLYARLYEAKGIAWARLGQAKTLYLRRRYGEARAMLEALLASHPQFLDAYDWLARVHETEGNLARARAVLGEAAARSPHALRRQRRLGQMALEAGDAEAAEAPLQRVVALARGSAFRDPEDHARLALALVRKGDPVRAAAVIGELDKSMAGQKNSYLCGAIATATLHDYTGNAARLGEALDAALLACRNSPGLSVDMRLELARNCLENGRREGAADVIRDLMRNGAPAAALGRAGALLDGAGCAGLGAQLALESRRQVVDMVAAGAAKARAGDFRAAVNLMLDAVGRLPDNPQVVFNAAVAVLKCLEHAGWDERLGQSALNLIGGVRRLDPGNPKLPALSGLHQHILKKYNVRTGRRRQDLAMAF